MSTSHDDFIPGLPDRSILYVSSTVHPDHPLHGVFRKHVDTGGFGPYPKRVLRQWPTRIVPTAEANYHIVRNFLSEFCADK